MATVRRMGPRDGTMSHAILDATERVLRNDGYAAATSRRIAQEAGCKQQLIYYYFQTIDDLLLEMFKRRTSRALDHFQQILDSDNPLRSLWHELNTSIDAVLTFEISALANHHAGIRREVKEFTSQVRKLQGEAIARQFKRAEKDTGPLTPESVSFFLYSIAMILGREEATGISEGHADVRAAIDWVIDRIT